MRFRRTALPLAFGLSLVGTSSAQDLRFSDNSPGGIVATGNTLGLSKDTGVNGPGIRDSIGTFLSLSNTVDDSPLNALNPWPAFTTNDWTQNGSSAVLSLPLESEVLYAELLWGGSFQYVEDVSAFLDDDVTLSMGAATMAVSPDPATSLTVSGTAASGFAVRYYMRSADVTSFVVAAGEGTYEVSGVPATQETTINSLNAAGWTLVVAYRNQNEPTRNLSVFVGGSFVDEDSTQDYSVSGFCAPPAGTVEGTAVVSAIEGDANLTGDQFLIAPTSVGPFASLSGPNNPQNNFFCSQLNDASGALDTLGSFGTDNHDAFAGTNLSGGRQGWDVTTIPLSSAAGQLNAGQTSAVLRTITTGDSYMPILAAFAIDVNSPDFGGAGSAITPVPSSVEVGDTFTLTATLENTGEVPAENLSLAIPLPSTVSLVSFSSDGAAGDINGSPVDEATLASGADEGDLPAGATRTVSLVLSLDGEPPTSNISSLATWSYEFQVCSNGTAIPEEFTQFFSVGYDAPVTTGGSGPGGAGPGGGGAQGGGGNGNGAGGNGSGGGEPVGGDSSGEGGSGGTAAVGLEDGCSCRTSTRDGDTSAAWLATLAALAISRLRRRKAARFDAV